MPRGRPKKEVAQNANHVAISKTNEEAAKEVAKRKRPDKTEFLSVHTDKGDNTQYLNHSMKMWNWQKPDMTNPEEVNQRIADYFNLCAEDDMKPSVSGMSLAFGVNRRTLWSWISETKGKYVAEGSREALKRAYLILETQMESYMQNGKIHPVAGIFLMKNNMGYEDKTEMVISPQSPIGETTDQKQLEAQYVIDVTDQQ